MYYGFGSKIGEGWRSLLSLRSVKISHESQSIGQENVFEVPACAPARTIVGYLHEPAAQAAARLGNL